jgi:diacylglycerol O-acyltransferase
MLRTCPYVPLAAPLRVGVAIFSYAGELVFGITGDYDTAPDIDVLANGIGEGVTELLRGNGHRTAEAAPRRSRAKPAKARPKPAGSRAKPTNARAKPTGSRAKPTNARAKPTSSRTKPTATRAKAGASRAKSTKASTRRRG